jgi:hypothetical protein
MCYLKLRCSLFYTVWFVYMEIINDVFFKSNKHMSVRLYYVWSYVILETGSGIYFYVRFNSNCWASRLY